ncbi:MAG: DegT/DnrJ/EryC1/StrS family aminotransferase [Bacillota bacterium]
MNRLAIDGAEPIRKSPFATWPYFEEDEICAVHKVLESGKVNYWTGEEGRLFEQEFATFAGCKYGVAVSNGTLALELALYALGIRPGDEVIVTSRTFIASASCAIMRGALPIMADVDPVSQNITADTVEKVLSSKTRAIIAVHLAGWPCDMDPLLKLAHQHGLYIVEDCAQAPGATYKGQPVGSFGNAAAFSFCQDKIMTTGGEGGMLTTNDSELWSKAWSYKDHGKNYDAVYNRQHPPGFRWVHESFGTNWRLTEMQSAIGRVAIKKISNWVQKRNKNASILTRGFAAIPALRVTIPPKEISHAYYKYYTFVRLENLKDGWDRDRILAAINAEGIHCFTGSCSEIYLEKAFEKERLCPTKRLKVARELGETSLMFLIHPTLSEEDMKHTCLAVEKVFKVAMR